MKRFLLTVLFLFFGLSAFADECFLTDILNGKTFHKCETLSGNKKCFISQIGDDKIDYRFDGKINRIGNKNVFYQNNRISQIGDDKINYRFDGIVSDIGGKNVYYQNGKIIKIGDDAIDYRFDGKINKIGNKNVNYQFVNNQGIKPYF